MPRDYAPYEDELDRTVFVNGLAYESTEADIRYFFEECGDIERINLPRYQNSDRNIGYCHVRFSRRRYAKRAVRLSGKYLDKRYLKIEMAQDMRSGGRHDRRDRFDRRDRYDRYGGGHRSSGYGGKLWNIWRRELEWRVVVGYLGVVEDEGGKVVACLGLNLKLWQL